MPTPGTRSPRPKPQSKSAANDLTRATIRAITQLVTKLLSDDPAERETILQWLQTYALPEVMEAVVQRLPMTLHLHDPERMFTIRAIMQRLGPAALRPDLYQSRTAGLLLMLQNPDPNERLETLNYIRKLLVRPDHALGKSRTAIHQEITPVLILAFQDREEPVRREAAKLLALMGADRTKVIDQLSTDLRQQGEDVPAHFVIPRMILGPRVQPATTPGSLSSSTPTSTS